MQAIRSINILAEKDTEITVPKDEIWRVVFVPDISGTVSSNQLNFSTPRAVILGGGTKVRVSRSDQDRPEMIIGIAFKL